MIKWNVAGIVFIFVSFVIADISRGVDFVLICTQVTALCYMVSYLFQIKMLEKSLEREEQRAELCNKFMIALKAAKDRNNKLEQMIQEK